METTNFLTFGAPLISDNEIQEVVDSLKSGWLGTGPKVADFEHNFASFKGVTKQNVAAVNSCTAALHVSMLAAGLQPGDEVITTPLTFCATVNSIIHAGLNPVLADINPKTYNICPKEIEKKITNKTKAIVPVHFAGRPCEMSLINDLAINNDLIIIEDCAHAIEAEYNGQKIGTIGNFGCFSFYVTKNLVTGEGGMVLADNNKDIETVKRLALHGMSKDAWHRFSDSGYKHYQVVDCGFKYNMMDLQAAIGLHQLKSVEAFWGKSKRIWELYNSSFSNLPITLPPPVAPKTKHAYHLYTIMIDEKITGFSRDSFLNYMTQNKIGVGVHYLSLPEHVFYQKKFNWQPLNYPQALKIGRQTVSIPLSPKLSENDIDRIITTVRQAF